ncbi:MAG TPA: poly(R)-hydroxyalkanoic acid synthase subunit PhaE [Polymorphobacter sp.]|nr:poly(R)-hydroxyalkanoic acid synthase subunit PhaE [Polymorphobacter sp.]
MSEAKLPDPAAMLRDMLGQWEKTSNEAMTQLMATNEFGRAMSQMTSMSLEAKSNFSEIFGKVLTGMNLPTRDELLTVATQIRDVDARLDRIETLLVKLTGASPVAARPAAPRPPRTRKPAQLADSKKS